MNHGYETKDGGATWSAIHMGIACNKIRIYRNAANQVYGFAIGKDVFMFRE
jgi:hypothetical protein